MYIKKLYSFCNEEGDGTEGAAGGAPEDRKQEGQQVTKDQFDMLQTQLNDLADQNKKLADNNKALLKEKIDAKNAAEEARLQALRDSGSKEELEQSWREKSERDIQAVKEELSTKITSYETMIHDLTVGTAAQQVAMEAFGPNAKIGMPHVLSRLKPEMENDKAYARVLDKNGKPAPLNLKELAEELKNDPDFASIAIGTLANGSGGRVNNGTFQAKKKFTEYTGAELSKIRKENPSEYDRLKSEHYGAA